jgi:hypothetical protein
MPADRVVPFRERAQATTAAGRSIARSIEKLPRLARINPAAAILIERHIDDWMVPVSPPEDGGTRTENHDLLPQAVGFRRQAHARLPIRHAVAKVSSK